MKKEKGINELVDMLFSENLSKSRLEHLGFSEEEAEDFLKMLNQDNSLYMRILNRDEREGFTSDAIIYLLSILQSNAIDRNTFEHVIAICMQIVYFSGKKMTKHRVDNVLNFVIFNESTDVSVKEMVDIFLLSDYEIQFDDEVH